LVKILMRYLRFRYRRHQFTSLAEINAAITECVTRINDRRHTRFGISRRARFEQLERMALKPLPTTDFDDADWKDAKLHPDCYVYVEATYYSAPHIHRGKKLRIKLSENQVEIFLNGERLALHPRDRSRSGKRVKIDAHFPDASLAYYEATPQHLLSQSRFIHPDLNQLVVDLFNVDVYGNIRRVHGLIRSANKEIHRSGRDTALAYIVAAIAEMRRVGRVRVSYFCELLVRQKHQNLTPDRQRDIVRRPGNPLLRYASHDRAVRDAVPVAAADTTTDPVPPTQEPLL
jgi:hypothetical protein